MRNKFQGICYRCGLIVKKGAGHFQRSNGVWLVQHAECAIKFRTGKKFCLKLKNMEKL